MEARSGCTTETQRALRETLCGAKGPMRVLTQLRGLPDDLLFRNAAKARSIPVVVIAKNTDLAAGEPDQLDATDWVKVIDPSVQPDAIRDAIKSLVFDWRTDLLRELECVGYAVTVGLPGNWTLSPRLRRSRWKGRSPGRLSA